MKNGEHTPEGKLAADILLIQDALLALAKDVHFVKTAVMILYGSVIDLSERTGPEKKAHMEKVLNAVVKAHEKEWKRRLGPKRKKK